MRWLMETEDERARAAAAAAAAAATATPADWRTALPEGIRADPSLASFKDVGALAQSFIETKSLVGKSIRPPGPDAKPETKKEFVDRLLQIEPALVYAPDGDPEAVNRMWKRLGKPEKPDEYEIPEQAKEAGLNPDDLRALAVTGGLTKAQFKGLVEVMAKASLEQKRLSALDRLALDQEWGAAKEERTLSAKAAALKMGLTEPEANALTPKQLKAFFGVAKAIGVNGNEFRKQGDGGENVLDPAEAKRQMDEIRDNPDYFDPYKNPGRHATLVAKMSKLSEMAYR
jgi:hypothetical protein